MKLVYILVLVLGLSSCSKMELPPPTPKMECSDVVVYKRMYWSDLLGRYVFTMQLKKVNGTYYNTDVWIELYFSKFVGDKLC